MRGKRVMAAALTAALSLGSAMGSMAAGWEAVGASDWKYLNDNGTYAASAWVEHTDGHWYYLKADTLMAKGWVLDPTDNHWYFTDSTGALVSGLIEVNNNVYYMNETHDGSFGALFVGQKTYNGVTYTFTENGTTNGKPYTSRKYNSDGTAIAAVSTTSGGSSSSYTGHFTGSTSAFSSATVDAVSDAQNKALNDLNTITNVTSYVELPTTLPAPTKGTPTPLPVKLKDGLTNENKDKIQKAAQTVCSTLFDNIVNQAETDNVPVGAVVVTVPKGIELPEGVKNNSKEYGSVTEAKDAINKMIKTWVEPDMYGKYAGKSATITIMVNNEPVSYSLSLSK